VLVLDLVSWEHTVEESFHILVSDFFIQINENIVEFVDILFGEIAVILNPEARHHGSSGVEGFL